MDGVHFPHEHDPSISRSLQLHGWSYRMTSSRTTNSWVTRCGLSKADEKKHPLSNQQYIYFKRWVHPPNIERTCELCWYLQLWHFSEVLILIIQLPSSPESCPSPNRCACEHPYKVEQCCQSLRWVVKCLTLCIKHLHNHVMCALGEISEHIIICTGPLEYPASVYGKHDFTKHHTVIDIWMATEKI